MNAGPFNLYCHATLGEYDLVKVNCRFETLSEAQAVAATFRICLSPASAKLVKGDRWTITDHDSGRVYSDRIGNSGVDALNASVPRISTSRLH